MSSKWAWSFEGFQFRHLVDKKHCKGAIPDANPSIRSLCHSEWKEPLRMLQFLALRLSGAMDCPTVLTPRFDVSIGYDLNTCWFAQESDRWSYHTKSSRTTVAVTPGTG